MAIDQIIITNPKQAKKITVLVTAIALLSSITACQSAYKNAKLTAPVIPKADSTFETYGKGQEKNDAVADAMNNAQITCQQNTQNKAMAQHRPIVIDYQVKYKGLLNEETDDLIEKVGRVIGAVSGTDIPSTRSKKDYEVTMNFKCVK